MSRRRRPAKAETNVVHLDELRTKRINLIPRSYNQETYIDLLYDADAVIVIASGPAGTGKTMLAVMAGLLAYQQGEVDKIILTRPAVGVDDEKHGFLPGDLNSKMEPWTRPLFDVIHEYYSPKQTQTMLENGTIEISPLAYMRGRTFKNSWVIADEMQNATPGQMKMLLTRLGDDSKMVVTGDIDQADKRAHDNGLLDFKRLFAQFKNSNFIEVIQFDHHDIHRHDAVTEVLKIYGDID